MGLKAITAVIQLFVGIVALFFVYISYIKGYTTINNPATPVLLAVFFLFATTFVTDRLCSMISELLTDKQNKIEQERWERIPGLLAGLHDDVSCPDRF